MAFTQMEEEEQDIQRMEVSVPGSARPFLELLQSTGASIPVSTEVRKGWSGRTYNGRTYNTQKSLAWQQASKNPTWDKLHLPQKL